MRRAALFLAVLVLLGGCRFLERRASFTLTFNIQSSAIREELIWSTLRIMERTAERLESPLTDKEVSVGSGSTMISITLKNSKATKTLVTEITKPFTLRFMRQVPGGEGSVTMKQQGSFEDLGIGEKELFWAEASTEEVEGKGAVRLLFTKEGFPIVQKIIAENRGKTIGLFMQDTLISTLKAEPIKSDVIIRGIPSAAIAQDFADRLNVGLHVTFASGA